MENRTSQPIQIHPKARRSYANHLDIALTISEVDLQFAQVSAQGSALCDAPAVNGWIVTTPVHLLTFSHAINRALARYRHAFGPIPDESSGEAR